MKNLFIAEKPSVANEFALALGGGAKEMVTLRLILL